MTGVDQLLLSPPLKHPSMHQTAAEISSCHHHVQPKQTKEELATKKIHWKYFTNIAFHKEKLTVGLSVHHNRSPAVAVGSAGRCENIVRGTLADRRVGGRERSRLRCERASRGQECCKAEESHGHCV